MRIRLDPPEDTLTARTECVEKREGTRHVELYQMIIPTFCYVARTRLLWNVSAWIRISNAWAIS